MSGGRERGGVGDRRTEGEGLEGGGVGDRRKDILEVGVERGRSWRGEEGGSCWRKEVSGRDWR